MTAKKIVGVSCVVLLFAGCGSQPPVVTGAEVPEKSGVYPSTPTSLVLTDDLVYQMTHPKPADIIVITDDIIKQLAEGRAVTKAPPIPDWELKDLKSDDERLGWRVYYFGPSAADAEKAKSSKYTTGNTPVKTVEIRVKEFATITDAKNGFQMALLRPSWPGPLKRPYGDEVHGSSKGGTIYFRRNNTVFILMQWSWPDDAFIEKLAKELDDAVLNASPKSSND